MLEQLVQLVILFTVIIDPLSSFAVFTSSIATMAWGVRFVKEGLGF